MSGHAHCLALMTDAFGASGGIAQYNRDFAAALASAPGIGDVEILPRLSPGPVGALPATVRQRVPRRGRLAYAAGAWRSAARRRPDLVFCGHLFMAPLAAAVAKGAGARLIVQTHGIEAWARPALARRLAAERADLILAVSRDTRARVLDWAALEPERVRVASNTVAEDFTPGDSDAARALFGLGDAFTILTVGRLDARERYKGHDRIIRLLAALGPPASPALYLIAGQGDDRPRLEALAAECGVADRVRFLGHVPRERLPDLYRAAQMFVLPSSGEGFGIVLLEAMACGAPALGLALGGAADALADGALGLMVDEAGFPEALRRALRDRCDGRLTSGEALSSQVRARFGRPAFERRVHAALASVGMS